MKRLNLDFEALPAYASFLLNERLEEYIRHNLQVARNIQLPLLKFFEHLGEDELFALSRHNLSEFFTYLLENRAADQVKDSLEQWRNNMLPLIDKGQIDADDISLTGIVRKTSFAHFLPEYTNDLQLGIKILAELDALNTAAELESYQLFLKIQREKIEQGYKDLEERDRLYKQSQALTHIGNWTWLAAGKITWSDELYRIYGLEPQSEELTFERFLGLIHPDDREYRVEQIQESMRTKQAKDYTMRIVTDAGIEKVLQGKNEVLLDEEGNAIGIAGTCQDITTEYHLRQQVEQDRQRLDKANRSLERKNAELERSNKELTSFSYVASHDLQEPLRKIKTFNSLIQKEAADLPEHTKLYLGKIDTSVSRMQTLIRDLLSFSHIHNDRLMFDTVDLNTIVADVVASLTETPSEKKLSINVALLPNVTGLSFQLNQLFANIISNAIKYSKDGDVQVHVKCKKVNGKDLDMPELSKRRDYHCISIIDNGIGFSEEYKDKIFEIFQRLHSKSEYSGTGIGLAICKKIVQNHNGTITAHSKEGEGATFDIYLPVQAEMTAA